MACFVNGFKYNDIFVKSPQTVMPEFLRHPEATETSGFQLLPE
uniref:Uncharacterized protein n=1 Tax=uncultured Desulfobacterium sp. TaxID=201089 RepID=E1YDT5_9BACT|nr:unknown protein [uncultured Desulfobacterium sp.]